MTLSAINRYDASRLATTDGSAVVIGGGIAGLTAARVLADKYQEVIIYEQDDFHEEVGPRRGVPQSPHFHVLTEAGRATIEDLFPGYCEELLAAGGLMIDVGRDWQFYIEGGFLAEFPTRKPMYCASRPLYEHILRRRVMALSPVELRSNCRCIDYRGASNGTTIQGVVIRDETGNVTEIAADVVVDASGRASRTPRWLTTTGYSDPPIEEIQVNITYASALVRRPPRTRRAVSVMPSPSSPRGGAALPVEDDRWMVTLWGIHDEEPPPELSEWSEFAAQLPVTQLARVIRNNAVVSSEIDYYQYPASVRRRYDQLDEFPKGLVVLGDALASFNPVYAQGMTVAVLNALVLHHVLAEDKESHSVGSRFFSRVASVVDPAWKLAAYSDFRYGQTSGSKPVGTFLVNPYLARFAKAAQDDGRVAKLFFRVLNMELHPRCLLHPRSVYRLIRA